MSLTDKHILPPVVIVINEFSSPAGVGQRDAAHPARSRDVFKGAMDVTKQGIFLIRECVDKDIGPAVIVIILEVDAHARKGLTLVVICNSRREPDFLERSVPLVSEELLGKRIVG